MLELDKEAAETPVAPGRGAAFNQIVVSSTGTTREIEIGYGLGELRQCCKSVLNKFCD